MSRIHPIQVLLDEHGIIRQVLKAMEKTVAQVTRDPGASGQLERILDVLESFFEGCHHQKEELALFPLLGQKGLSGTARILLDDHQTAHTYMHSLRQALALAAVGNLQALDFLRSEGLAYVALAREHLRQEEEVLFDVARQVLTGQEIDEIEASSSAVEERYRGEEIRQKYPDLLGEPFPAY